jgi:hypothetical protein
MESSSKLYTQIAAQAGVSEADAQRAAYLRDLAADGRTLDSAAALLRIERADARDIARDWGIAFPDYQSTTPVQMVWSKPRRGEWELRHGDTVVARALSDGHGGYKGQWEMANASIGSAGPNAEVAARRLSKQIERQSIGLFGVDDIEIVFPEAGVLAPIPAAEAPRMRQALAA